MQSSFEASARADTADSGLGLDQGLSTFTPSAPGTPALAALAALNGTPGHYSEWLEGPPAAATPAARWQAFFQLLGDAGWAELAQRQRVAAQRVHDDLASYNIHTAPGEGAQPWPLALLPLIVQADEWTVIEQGVVQRARMLEATLADLYGPQQLLRDALLPDSLVFAHPHYLRAMHEVQPLGGTRLHLLAFDVARAPEGGFCVLAQRLQAPIGLGYLLENRLIARPQLDAAFSGLRVQRLAGSFRAWLAGLQRASPAGERSRIVLLTPGPLDPNYFEQVFLARYLGVTMVEGSDLTVRANRLYLKTLHELEQVHVVLRRIDDEWLDPLELRAESALGIPGLLQALRAGNVVMANAPGAGVLESPGLSAFWPALAERLLGQPLLLPAPTSWWCGEASVWQRQRANLVDFVVAPTFPDSRHHAVVAAHLPPDEQLRLAARIDADPAAFTLQAPLHPAQTPVWVDGHLQPRSAVLRVFVLADGQGGWLVLPGARTRLVGPGEPGHDPWLANPPGSASADTWVIASGEVDDTTLLPAPLSAHELQEGRRTVTSRSAENLFWLGRYTERAENALRLARLTLENLGQASPAVLGLLDDLARRHGLVPPDTAAAAQDKAAFEFSLLHNLGMSTQARGVVATLRGLRRCAQALRERLSPEHWQLIHELDAQFEQQLGLAVGAESGCPARADAFTVMAHATTQLAAITGAQTDRMTRDDGWRLLSVGRQIERLDMLAHALARGFERRVHEADDGFMLLLGLFDSVITYRAQFQGRREVLPLLHLLVLDTDNPRSLAWVARTMRERLRKLARRDEAWAEAVTATLPVPDKWLLADLDERDGSGAPARLISALQQCSASAQALSNDIDRQLFAHVAMPERKVWQ